MNKFDQFKKRISKMPDVVKNKLDKKGKVSLDLRQAVKSLLVGAILALGVFQLVFGIMIYGLGMETNTVRAAARIVPFPAAYTTSGVVTVDQYLVEKSYIEHFYNSTDQADFDQDEIRSQIMNQLIENRLIYNEALKHKIYVSDAEVNQVFDQIVEENGGKDEVDKVLDELYGLSADQFKELVEVQLLREKMDSEVLAKVRTRHILIRADEDASDEGNQEAKTKIDKHYKDILEDGDFSEVAKEHSEDVGSAEMGGELAPFAHGEMVPEFEEVAFSTPVGEVSEPFKTSFGWHILKVEDRTGVIDKSFTDWVAELREEAVVLTLYK